MKADPKLDQRAKAGLGKHKSKKRNGSKSKGQKKVAMEIKR